MTTATPSRTPDRSSFQPTRQQALFAFIVLLVINILNYMDRTILPAVLSHLKLDFPTMTDGEAGLLGSSFLLIYGIATLPLGMLADRTVRKNIVAVCAGLWSIATAMAGFSHTFIQLFIARSFLGVGEAGYAPASLSMIGDYFPKEQRGRILSLWSVSNLFGTALGLIVGGVVAQWLNWRWAFYIVGIPGLIAAFLIWRAYEPRRGAFDTEGGTKEEAATGHGNLLSKDFLVQAGNLFRIPTYWVLLAAFVFSFFIVGGAQFWIPNYVERTFVLNSAQGGLLSGGTLAGGALVGTLLGGWLADALQKKIPQGRMLIATIAFLVGAPLTLLALSLHDLSYFTVMFIIAIVCLSMCLGPINAILQDIVTPNLRATAVGLALLAGHILGDASSPTIIGYIAQIRDLSFALMVTAPTCLFLAGLICLVGLKTVKGDMEHMQAQLHKEQASGD